jgi:hypothetical protein
MMRGLGSRNLSKNLKFLKTRFAKETANASRRKIKTRETGTQNNRRRTQMIPNKCRMIIVGRIVCYFKMALINLIVLIKVKIKPLLMIIIPLISSLTININSKFCILRSSSQIILGEASTSHMKVDQGNVLPRKSQISQT